MNSLFLDDLLENLEEIVPDVWTTRSQESLKYKLDYGYWNFPMICFEKTDDSSFEVSMDESKFLNDSSHKGLWIVGHDDDFIYFILNLKENKDSLEIDTIEVNEHMRGEGIGGNIVSTIENVAEDYYDRIVVSPFDTSAMNFWEHMEYKEIWNGYWIKEL